MKTKSNMNSSVLSDYSNYALIYNDVKNKRLKSLSKKQLDTDTTKLFSKTIEDEEWWLNKCKHMKLLTLKIKRNKKVLTLLEEELETNVKELIQAIEFEPDDTDDTDINKVSNDYTLQHELNRKECVDDVIKLHKEEDDSCKDQ